MAKEFEIAREFEADASPGQVWDALTTGTGGWLWPMEYEPREGGAAPFGGTVTHWDPPHRLTGRVDGPDGARGQALNQLDHVIEPRDGGRRAWVRYVHSGLFEGDWENRYDGADRHTGFYLHTLRQYLTHFTGRPAVFTAVEAPDAGRAQDAFEAVGRQLGLPDDAAQGARIRAQGPEGEALDVVVDFRDDCFVGLRSEDAMYRFFGRNRFGAPVGVSVHDFTPGADAARNEQAWQLWLDRLFG